MKRSAPVAGFLHVEGGVCRLEVTNLSMASGSAQPPTSFSQSSASPTVPNNTMEMPRLADIIAKITDGTLVTHETKQSITSRQMEPCSRACPSSVVGDTEKRLQQVAKTAQSMLAITDQSTPASAVIDSRNANEGILAITDVRTRTNAITNSRVTNEEPTDVITESRDANEETQSNQTNDENQGESSSDDNSSSSSSSSEVSNMSNVDFSNWTTEWHDAWQSVVSLSAQAEGSNKKQRIAKSMMQCLRTAKQQWDCVAQAQGTFVKFHSEHFHTTVQEGKYTVADLPLIEVHGKGKKFKEFFRLIHDVSTEDQAQIREIMAKDPNNTALLPDSVRPGDVLGEACTLQLVIDTRSNAVLQFFHSSISLPWGVVRLFCRDKPMLLNYKIATNSDLVKCACLVMLKGIEGDRWMKQSLGTKLVRSKSTSEKDASSWDPSPEELREGIDFINMNAPLANGKNEQFLWSLLNVRDNESPIYAWPMHVVSKACQNRTTGDSQAEPEFFFPLLVEDLNYEFVNKILPLILPTMTTHGLILLGRAGIGKNSSGWRRSKQIDGFRERPGEITVPVLLDDPILSSMSLEDIKSFLDVGETTLVDARYRAAKFARNQTRILLNNEWKPENEPDLPFADHISWGQFLNMFHTSMNDAGMPHLMAILKRATVVIAGGGVTEDWLRADNKSFYSHYKDGRFVKYPKYEENLAKEADMMVEILASPEEKEYLKRGATYDAWHQDFGNETTDASRASASTPPPRAGAEVSQSSPLIRSPPSKMLRMESGREAEEYDADEEATRHLHGALAKAHEIEATLYSMTGYETVLVRTFRCTTYSCRRTFGPNFAWDASSKINTASPLDLKNMEALFVNSKVGFSLSFLEYHALMEFRACLSARAVEYVYQHTFGLNTAGNMSNRWRLSYSSAIMCYVAIHELAPLHLHMKIVLGNEISSDILAKYEQHVLGHVLPAKNRTKVSEVVCDGHAKVHVKCASARNHAGKPRADGKKKPYGHGWFMVVNPADKRILWAKPMLVPEGNDILEDAITSILPSYKNMNCVIVDRACSFYPSALKQKRLKQIKFWVVDKFHSHGHTKSNSNGAKKFYINLEDEVSFVMSKDLTGKPCAASVVKERKGAWRTNRGRRLPGAKDAKKETIKDQVKRLTAMDTDQVLQNATLFREILDSPDFEFSHLYKVITMLASKDLLEDTRSDRIYRLFLESNAMQACLRTTIIKQGAGRHHGNFLEDLQACSRCGCACIYVQPDGWRVDISR
ncbi:unnamed protein product [Symbiodinium natans]|uniref:Uncharacterized protein n=1 Tax=Symbiodinium natans TaxID=878477 RepID=A0A812QWN1_9DINO|nr:unnamed protein product [Symbiodinium natans]